MNFAYTNLFAPDDDKLPNFEALSEYLETFQIWAERMKLYINATTLNI